MAELFETQERTEEATPRRREEARARGQFARSSDLATAIVLLAIAGTLFFWGPTLLRLLGSELSLGLQRLTTRVETPLAGAELLRATLLAAARLAGPFIVLAAAAGVTLHVVQAGGFFVARDGLAIKLERLDPMQNLGKVLSARSFAKIAAALLKLLVVVAVLYFSLQGRLDDIGLLAGMEFEIASAEVGRLTLALFLRASGALLVLGGIDFFFQRWQHSRDLRMSKQQVRDESKNEDGDPAVKRRIRDRMRQISEKPLQQAVAGAAVVITNPTHFAVALDYVEGKSAAPTVAAKGVDRVAEEIKRIARDANVPVIEQPPLARALFKDVPVGKMIPEPLYRAVAAVLAIVWRLREEKKRKKSKSAAPAVNRRK